ncbi:MAG TPA: hypothetical protein VMF09_03820 [Solirubrobacteraceae bacterium]|nr:hypothetical protein [Solirubrobacteraceae bacterium]
MLRRVAIPALLTSGAVLAACAGGHAASSGQTHSGTSAARIAGTSAAGVAGTSRAHARGSSAASARARAFAAAVNLRAADVPGFARSRARAPKRESASERNLEREFHRCAGGLDSGSPVAEAGSPTYERKVGLLNAGVSSSVTVERTAAAAARSLQALHSSHIRGCLSHVLELLFKGQRLAGAKVGAVSVRYGTPPAPGTAGGYGLRVKTTVTVRRVPIPFYLDVLGFVDGPAQVSLQASSIAAPLPAQLEEHLFTLLLERAKAHAA